MRAVHSVLIGLLLALLLGGVGAARPLPSTGGGWDRFFTSDVSTPPLVAPCETSVATLGLLPVLLPGDGHMRADFTSTSLTGTISLSTGGTLTLPCSPCTLVGPALPGAQVSLTLAGATCPGPTVSIQGIQLAAGP